MEVYNVKLVEKLFFNNRIKRYTIQHKVGVSNA